MSRKAFSVGVAALFGGRETSRTSETVHEVVTFRASPARVYRCLTTASEFDRVVRLSAAMRSMKRLGADPTRIDARPGGAFALFGGYVTGRTIELVPNARIVQAWRSASWSPGIYSIVTFALSSTRGGTRLVLHQAGFPDGDAASLARGWHENYWEPLRTYLG
jgi:activator of HSP90 ATPase